MNNLFSIVGVRENAQSNFKFTPLGGYFVKESPDAERSNVSGFAIDHFEQAEIMGKYEKTKISLRITYRRPFYPLSFKLNFDEDKKLWIGKYSCNGKETGNVRLTIVPLEEEVKFVPPSYQNNPKK